MNWIQALVLGAVQGLTEFLPVSSTGHLRLFEIAFHVNMENAPLFDVLLHVGTLAAVCVVMWEEIRGLIRKPFKPLMGYLVIATVPAILAVLLFNDQIDKMLYGEGGMALTGILLGVGFLVTSVFMFVTPLFKKQSVDMDHMGVIRPFLIGIAQAVAILPSVSRSGSTILTGMATGLKREDVARFSFLMSIPAIFGGVAVQVWKLLKADSAQMAGSIDAFAIILGMCAAGITGYFALRVLIDTIKSGKLWIFGVYTALLGTLILIDVTVVDILPWFSW